MTMAKVPIYMPHRTDHFYESLQKKTDEARRSQTKRVKKGESEFKSYFDVGYIQKFANVNEWTNEFIRGNLPMLPKWKY